MLRGCPALTSLEVCDARGDTVTSQLPMIVQCSNLRELRLFGFVQSLPELFQSLSCLPLLRVLWLDDRCGTTITMENASERLRSALGQMQPLTELQLACGQTIVQLAPALSQARSLRSLVAKGLDLNSLSRLIDSGAIQSGLADLPLCVFEAKDAEDDL